MQEWVESNFQKYTDGDWHVRRAAGIQCNCAQLLLFGFQGGSLGGDTSAWRRAEGRERAASRGFACRADSYGHYACLSMHITDSFHGRPYGFMWICGATHMGFGAPKLNEVLTFHMNFLYVWFVVHMWVFISNHYISCLKCSKWLTTALKTYH